MHSFQKLAYEIHRGRAAELLQDKNLLKRLRLR